MPKVLPYFPEVRGSWCGHWTLLLLKLWLFCTQVACISWSWWLLLLAIWKKTVIFTRVNWKIILRFKNGKSFTTICKSNCKYAMIPYHGHHIEIAISVSTVIVRIQDSFSCTHEFRLHEHVVQHTCGVYFFMNPSLL